MVLFLGDTFHENDSYIYIYIYYHYWYYITLYIYIYIYCAYKSRCELQETETSMQSLCTLDTALSCVMVCPTMMHLHGSHVDSHPRRAVFSKMWRMTMSQLC